MIAPIHHTSDHLLVAIDIAKKHHDVLVAWPSGREKAYKITNDRQGHDELVELLHNQGCHVTIALEPTADYHRNIAYRLAESGFSVHLASSLACARVREALYTSWDKHDRKDAKVILHLLRSGMTHPFCDSLREGHFDYQELANTYHQISMAWTRCHHSLFNHYLTLYFPEMERFFFSSRSEWFCRFLLQFPTPTAITSKEAFIESAWDVVGRKVAKQRLLAEIYELAENSTALPIPLDSIAIQSFRMQLQRHLNLTGQRKELEEIANQIAAEREGFQRLRTLPGVGPIIALMIVAESGDLRRFAHHRQYLKFCGFNLAASQSGQSQSRYRLSKRGNARLRYAYWLAGTVAIQQGENSFKHKFEKYIRRDPDNRDLRRKAMTAVAVKMARVAHALVKTSTDYRGFYEASIPGGGT